MTGLLLLRTRTFERLPLRDDDEFGWEGKKREELVDEEEAWLLSLLKEEEDWVVWEETREEEETLGEGSFFCLEALRRAKASACKATSKTDRSATKTRENRSSWAMKDEARVIEQNTDSAGHR